MAAGKPQAIAGATGSESHSEPSALFARLQRGEISVDEYLDERLSKALAPFLNGKLSADRVEWLKGMLRDQLVADPVLAEYVRQATGREPLAT